jgi:glycosyltransferase involved in cell wall biosynthesis
LYQNAINAVEVKADHSQSLPRERKNQQVKSISDRICYLFLVPWDPKTIGGVNQVVTNLFDQVARDGKYQPLVCVNDFNYPTPWIAETTARTTIYSRIKAPWDRSRPLKHLVSFLFSLPRTLARLYAIKNEYNISVMNIHYPGLTAFTLILLKSLVRKKLILILSFHGLDAAAVIKSKGIEKLIWEIILKRVDRIIFCSEALKGRMLTFAPDRGGKMRVVHNGIDVTRASMETDRNNWSLELTNRRYILNVATFEEKKGQDILVTAFRDVAAKDADITLVLMGASGKTSDRIRQMVAMLGLQGRVFIYENVSNGKVLAAMERAELFVLPSRDEPFGIVLLEAALFSVPVIATRVGGVPEVVLNGETGLLVEPEDVEALTKTMLRLLGNEEERRILGQAMHQRALAEFSWQSAYQKYISIINDVQTRGYA